MKRSRKWIALMLALCLMLPVFAGCAPRKALNPGENAKQMEFPGLHWFDSPDAVKQALNIPADEIQEGGDKMGDMGSMFTILWEPKDFQLFGQAVYTIFFQFQDYNDTGALRLSMVTVHYPQEADMEAVRKDMTAYFGPAPEAYTICKLEAGKAVEQSVESTDAEICWPSKASLADLAAQEEKDAYWSYASQAPMPPESRDALDAFLAGNPATTVTWAIAAYKNMTPMPGGRTNNCVTFNANALTALKYQHT